MKLCTVICELNPFHNGHALLLREAKEQTGADLFAAVMSGNYVQRGEPAVFDKYLRCRMALTEGFDLVTELPVPFAVSPAGDFAAAGVRLAMELGSRYLAFGVEADTDPGALREAAALLLKAEADDAYYSLLREQTSAGKSYPAARAAALSRYGGSGFPEGLLSGPNNILALEYLKSMLRFHADMEPVFVMRRGDACTAAVPSDAGLTSATALRGIILREGISSPALSAYMPASVLQLLRESRGPLCPVDASSLSVLLSLRLLEALQTECPEEALLSAAFMSRDIAARLLASAHRPMGFYERAEAVKARNLTLSGIRRALLALCLGLKKQETEALKASGYIPYIRLLGFKKSAGPLLKALKTGTELPVIAKAADHKPLLDRSILFDELYYALPGEKAGGKGEYGRALVLI